jgi:hypothetical protein
MHHFGQCPAQLFSRPHPARAAHVPRAALSDARELREVAVTLEHSAAGPVSPTPPRPVPFETRRSVSTEGVVLETLQVGAPRRMGALSGHARGQRAGGIGDILAGRRGGAGVHAVCARAGRSRRLLGAAGALTLQALACEPGGVEVLKTQTLQRLAVWPALHHCGVTSIAVPGDLEGMSGPRVVATGGGDGTVAAWDTARAGWLEAPPRPAGRAGGTVAAHVGPVTALAVSQVWGLAASGGADGATVIVDVWRAARVARLLPDGAAPIVAVAIDEENGAVFSATAARLAVLSCSGALLAEARQGAGGAAFAAPVSALAARAGGYAARGAEGCVTGHEDGSLRWWGVRGRAGGAAGALPCELEQLWEIPGLGAPLTALRLAEGYAACGDARGAVRVWVLAPEAAGGDEGA